MRKPLPDSRICRLCGLEFKPKSRLLRCNDCVNELARKTRTEKIKELIQSGELILHADRKPEEMQGGKDGIYVKYRELQRMCSKMDRDEFKVYARNKLNEIMENEKLWKYLTREGLGETVPKKDVVKKPKLSKREKWIQRGDTRNLSWDELERMGFGLDEDK